MILNFRSLRVIVSKNLMFWNLKNGYIAFFQILKGCLNLRPIIGT